MKSRIPFSLCRLTALLLTLLAPPAPIQSAASVPATVVSVYLPLIARPAAPGDDVVTGLLINAGTVATPAGVGIGALAASLESPITVTIATTTTPAIPVPAPAVAIGNFYAFQSASEASPPNDNPFILAFPVPDGVVTTTLGVGVLESAEDVLDTQATAPAWTTLEGLYDPLKKLFLTTSASLSPAGRVYVLLSEPSLSSPLTAAANSPRLAAPSGVPFVVRCQHFASGECTTSIKTTAAGYLNQIYQRIRVDLTFEEPRIRSRASVLGFSPNVYGPDNYLAYIEPRSYGTCLSAEGYYDISEQRLVLCIDPAHGLNSESPQVLVHEYFHATEYGYTGVRNNHHFQLDEDWIIEGMAKSAEESYFLDEMQRSLIGGWVQLHDVDVALNDPGTSAQFYEYFAQDFWVYAGQQAAQNLTILKGVLNFGATTHDAAQALGDGQTLELYWLWAKDQAEEPAIDFNGALKTPCQLETAAVKQTIPFNYVFGTHVFQVFTLKPLQSAVLKVKFDHNYLGAASNGYPVNPNLPGAVESLRFKLYQEGESGCEAVPDGNRVFNNLSPSDTYYAVFSNIDATRTFDYLLGFETSLPPSLARPH